MAKRGAIRDKAKYIRAKTFDHSGWDGLLPRNATPSDNDVVFSNRDAILIAEYKPFSNFECLQPGQRKLLMSFVAVSKKGLISAALCHSDQTVGESTDSLKDVIAFTYIFQANPEKSGKVTWWSRPTPGALWRQFVLDFYYLKSPEFMEKWREPRG